MNQENSEKILYTLDEKFRFSCHQDLACFNTCCRDITIFLTPYDVLRMRKCTGLPSEEFLEKYTIALLGEDGIPLVALRMNEDEKKTCPFVNEDGCSIYLDRPWSCRMFPVFPTSSEEREFLIQPKASCLGFKEDQERTTREWKQEQNIEMFDRMNEEYKAITHHDFFMNGNKLDRGKSTLVYRAVYDLDAFKKFLFGSRFFEIYDVDDEVIEKIKSDDEELLRFGYRWVRFSLFSENTLQLKDKQMDELMKAKGGTAS